MRELIRPLPSDSDSFEDFVREAGPKLKQALMASLGGEAGREAAAESLAWGWEHWDRLRAMDNPAAYLFRVGKSRGIDRFRADRRRRVAFPRPPDSGEPPWIEPALPGALGRLSEMQRTTVMLLHAFGWTYREVAEFLGIATGSVQRHAERGMKKLRSSLKVGSDV